jgi:hypothetical protein
MGGGSRKGLCSRCFDYAVGIAFRGLDRAYLCGFCHEPKGACRMCGALVHWNEFGATGCVNCNPALRQKVVDSKTTLAGRFVERPGETQR